MLRTTGTTERSPAAIGWSQPKICARKLAADYGRMSAMIFDIPPSFPEVMASIEELERHLNAPAAALARGIPLPGDTLGGDNLVGDKVKWR